MTQARAAVVATAAVVALLLVGTRTPTELGMVLAWLTLVVPAYVWLRWHEGGHKDVPVFPAALLVPALAFVAPLFLQEDLSIPVLGALAEPDTAELDRVMVMVVIGVASMVGGHAVSRRIADRGRPMGRWRRSINPEFVALALAGGVAIALVGVPVAGGGFREALRTVATAVPVVALVLLLERWLQVGLGLRDKLLVCAWLGVSTVQALASGWLGAVAAGPLLVGLATLRIRGRFPLGILVPVTLVFLFLQPAKVEFRRHYWSGGGEGSTWEKGLFWIERAVEHWSAGIGGGSREDTLAAIQPVVNRTSLLPFGCLVQRLTPETVPFQGLTPYKYLAVGLVPRFLWPGKPSFDEANRFVQVAYGITREEDLGMVSIAVGVFSEGFMAAGWLGVVLASGLLGAVCGLVESLLGRPEVGAVPNAVALALVPRFLVVESQMAQLASGILQTVVACWVIFAIGATRKEHTINGATAAGRAETGRDFAAGRAAEGRVPERR